MAEQTDQGITHLTVSGYKSISREQRIEIRPLTVLAGANSAGKSSMVQPLMLLKQTIEVTYDPGPLLLNGPNVQFSALRQLLARGRSNGKTLTFGVGFGSDADLTISFERTPGDKPAIVEMLLKGPQNAIRLTPEMGHEEILAASSPALRQQLELSLTALRTMYDVTGETLPGEPQLKVVRRRCFLDLGILAHNDVGKEQPLSVLPLGFMIEPAIRSTIHLPGIRELPGRSYPVSATGPQFPGTFQEYVASIIANWQEGGRQDLITQLSVYLADLGLTRSIVAEVRDSTQIDLRVDRMPVGQTKRPADMVNIADVGVSVSQTLPVLVALLVAQPGQLVAIEQPELHLHLSAQVRLARALADAARRGVRVLVETHSSLLLLSIQTLVAQGELDPDLVKLHWFDRDASGFTKVSSSDVDETGAFGDWPENFDTVELEAQRRYLDAAEARQAAG